MAKHITGSCLCGSVKYEINGDPVFAGLCHCKDCQKYTGTGHAAPIGFLENMVTVTGDTTSFAKTADSGGTITRNFCPKCGSPVYNTLSHAPGVMVFAAGTFDDLNQYEPQISVYASRAAKWDQPAEGIPSFAEMPPQG
jgi:hypothetical protein